jgi:creatinine amidohydrolase/Fe(II)-dependent formamide hydrolase-like protein
MIFRIALIAGFAAALGLAEPPVNLELMTYAEVASAIHQGKTTVLVYNGGTEQRGPHAVLGGHTLMAQRTSDAIARRLGNALVAPVMPFSPAGGHLNPKWPGTVSVPVEVFISVNEAVVHSMVVAGFKNIILMGDHGGGQKELETLAGKLNAKYAHDGAHVYFCDLYAKTLKDTNEFLEKNGYPPSVHAGIPDTSEMMYLGSDAWVRKDKITAGDPVGAKPGQKRIDNGITGDPRRSSAELGKRFFDMKVDYGVQRIQQLTAKTP